MWRRIAVETKSSGDEKQWRRIVVETNSSGDELLKTSSKETNCVETKSRGTDEHNLGMFFSFGN